MAMSYDNSRIFTKFNSRPMHIIHHDTSMSINSLDDSDIYSDDRDDHHHHHLTNHQKPMDAEKCTSTMGRIGRLLSILAYIPVFGLSVTGMGISFLIAVFICPRAIGEKLLFPAFRLLFGTLYPAYASYKAVRTKNVKEYVKWMMYWIVYALFTCTETFTDIFLSWFPFYYEVKVIIVIWLLSPATKGSSTLYRKFVHPMLTRREQEIDEYINQAKEKGYTAVLQLGSKGMNYATNVIMQTALKGGGNLVQTIRRSYSLSDLSEPDAHRTQDEIDSIQRPQRFLRPRTQTARSSSGGRHVDMYFSEVDVGTKTASPNYNYIRSSEDISSGYSSAEPISGGLSRTSSMTNPIRTRLKARKAEGEIYLESDEYETIENVVPSYNYPKIIYHSGLHPSYDSDSDLIHASPIDEYRDEIIFDNEKYFQQTFSDKPANIQIKSREEGERKAQMELPGNLPENMTDKYFMFCRWLQDQKDFVDGQENEDAKMHDEKESKLNGEKLKPENAQIDIKSENVKDVDEMKSCNEKMFVKDEASQKQVVDKVDIQNDVINALIEESNSKNDEIKQELMKQEIKQIDKETELRSDESKLQTENAVPQEEDDFQDTTSQGSAEEDETFLDADSKPIVNTQQISDNTSILVEDITAHIDAEQSVELPKETSIGVVESNTHEENKNMPQDDNAAAIQSITLQTIENLVKNVNARLQEETALLKRPSSHSKGKAPSPPVPSLENTSSSSTNVNTTITTQEFLPSEQLSTEFSASISSLISMKSSKSDTTPSTKDTKEYLTTRKSITPEPSIASTTDLTNTESPKKSKRSLFKSYLPSIFRSESPKPNAPKGEDYPKETEI